MLRNKATEDNSGNGGDLVEIAWIQEMI